MFVYGLDNLDNKILNVIKDNARLSYSEIGAQVGLSRVAVKARMQALEKKGIIEGYKTKINAESAPEGRRFFLEVVTKPDQFEQVVDRIATQEVIKRVYAVTGDSRIMAEGYATKRMQYENFTRYLRNNSNGIERAVIADALYPIKNVYGGVDYVSLKDRKKSIENEAPPVGGEHENGKESSIDQRNSGEY